jgi:class 3 adenylate cyclase/tetratricopeptide (TPR) repeat protein
MAVCVACGAENRTAARFCDVCGAPLPAAVPPQEQRKTVTVLFCDVVGSTELGESADPEALRALLARYFERMKTIVEAHGGSVEKFIGDAVMAVFGVPVVHEDDAVRAVRAAWEMRDALPELGVRARIGVNTGEVVTGTTERLATGDAVNVAARLQQAAGPGEVLLGAETRALARDAVTVEKLAPLELKGKRRPVDAFRLTSVERLSPGVGPRFDAPMVGRAEQRRLLEDAFASVVRNRSCELFTLLGTAGVGKSRLAREFLAGVDARVLAGRCLSYGEGITYWPVVELVKQLGDSVEPLLAGNDAASQSIGALLGEATAAATAQEIAWAVRKLLEAAAEERPLVVVLDDVHWGEPTFLDLVEHVADLSRDAPILILCIARQELLDKRPGWGGGRSNARTLPLEPLDAAETDELIDELLGGEQLDPGLMERIRIAAAGHPLYVEEMLAMVRESTDGDVAVPPTIKALLAARIDALESGERGVLERGSIEGQLFHTAAVEALAQWSEPVVRELVSLVRKDLVQPDKPQLRVGDAYRFRHILIRDAAYDALSKTTRAELHEKFASWLEAHGGDLVEGDEIVAYHFEQAYRYRAELGAVDAELAERACRLLVTAARLASTRGDLAAAANLLGRAVNLPTPERARLLPELGELLKETGKLERAGQVFDEAYASAQARGDEAAAALARMWRTVVAQQTGDHEATDEGVIALAEKAAALLVVQGDRQNLASALFIAGQHRFFTGRAREAETLLEQGRVHAFASGDLSRERMCAYWTIGVQYFGAASVSEWVAFESGLRDELRTALDAIGALDGHRACMACFSGDFERARELWSMWAKRMTELGLEVQSAGSAMFRGEIELLAGDPVAAERELRDGYDRLGELGETSARATVGPILADALLRLGRHAEAEAVLDETEVFAAPDDVDAQTRIRTIRARLRLQQDDVGAAERLAREAVVLAATTDYIGINAGALVALGAALRALGEEEAAATALREALDLYERKENLVLAEQTRELLAAVSPA